jgi:hypothetical protein
MALSKARVWKEELDDDGKENCSLCLGMAGSKYLHTHTHTYIYLYIYKFPEEKKIEKAIFIKKVFRH